MLDFVPAGLKLWISAEVMMPIFFGFFQQLMLKMVT